MMGQQLSTGLGRLVVGVLVLLSGLMFLPFTNLSAEQLNWQSLAGVYQPNLSVNHGSGAPGSFFLLSGNGYPGNAVVTVFIDGQPAGTVNASGNGRLRFLIDSTGGAPATYFVTASADANTSATADFTLANGQPVWPKPGGNFVIFTLGAPTPTPTPVPPTPTPAPGCTSQCLLSGPIQLRATSAAISARVVASDENGAATPGAVVNIAWTLPNGNSVQQSATVTPQGFAPFQLNESAAGMYTLTVQDITLSGWTFDPANSVLSGSITK